MSGTESGVFHHDMRFEDLVKEYATYRADVEPVLRAAVTSAHELIEYHDELLLVQHELSLVSAVSASRECQRIKEGK